MVTLAEQICECIMWGCASLGAAFLIPIVANTIRTGQWGHP